MFQHSIQLANVIITSVTLVMIWVSAILVARVLLDTGARDSPPPPPPNDEVEPNADHLRPFRR